MYMGCGEVTRSPERWLLIGATCPTIFANARSWKDVSKSMPVLRCPFAPLPNGMKIEVHMSKDAQKLEHVFWAHTNVANDAAYALAVGNAVGDWFHDNYRGILPTDVILRETIVTLWDAFDSARVISTESAGDTGSAGSSMPNNVSLAVHKNGPARGRGRAGRVYVAGIPTSAVTNVNEVTSAYATSAVAAFNGLIAKLSALTPIANLIVAHTQLNKACLSELTFNNVTSFGVVDNVLDSQRRRLPGRGR